MPQSRVIFLGAQGGTWIIFKHWQHDKCTTSPTIELKKSSKKKLRLKISFWLSVLSPFFFDQFVRLTILHILRCCQPLTTGFLVSINFFSPTIWVMLVHGTWSTTWSLVHQVKYSVSWYDRLHEPCIRKGTCACKSYVRVPLLLVHNRNLTSMQNASHITTHLCIHSPVSTVYLVLYLYSACSCQ